MPTRWISRLLPAATNTRPSEWSRAAIGVSLGTLFSVWVCSQFFGLPVAMHLIGPLGASAILLFAVSSGALAQPWSIVGGYLCATVVSLGVVYFLAAAWTAPAWPSVLPCCACARCAACTRLPEPWHCWWSWLTPTAPAWAGVCWRR